MSEQNPLSFHASAVRNAGTLHYEGSVEPEDFQEALGESPALKSELAIELDLVAQGDRISMSGRVRGKWSMECARCLAHPDAPYEARVEASFEPEVQKIDAAEEVRQSLLLAVPPHFYCRPDCKGLCPSCGADRNARDCGCRPPGFDKFGQPQGEKHA